MDYSTNAFIENLYERTHDVKNLINCEIQEMECLIAAKRTLLRDLLGIGKLELLFPHFCPVFKFEELTKADGFSVSRFTLETLPSLFMPFYVLEPENGSRGRAVVYCHGHGAGVAETFHENPAGGYHNFLPAKLAKAGYTVLAPEFMGFGESVFKGFKQDGEKQNGCYANAANLMLHGITLVGVRVNQALQVIMYAKRAFNSISLFGISGGGMVAAYASAIEQLTDNLCVSGYVCTYRKSIMSIRHCIDNFVPNIFAVGECAEIASLSARKNILIMSGEDDRIFPSDGVRQAFRHISKAYGRLGIAERAELLVFPGGHEIDCEGYIGWLSKHLANSF